ncbi:MAG TPA: cytochrome c biogenesis CcdA family protein [Ramlibacter sp.]
MADLGVASYGLGFAAGALSTLSPCVLPVVPILVGSAVGAHPRGPLALAGGLALSYAVFGSALAWATSALEVEPTIYRTAGAAMLAALGVLMLSSALQARLAAASSGLADAGHRLLERMHLDGIGGQFVIGVVLGIVWTPCVGPTLGAAVALASQGANLPQATAVMALFGLGAVGPILVVAYGSRAALARRRSLMLRGGRLGKALLAIALLAVAGLILLGADKRVESWLLDHSPPWLTRLTTRI